MCMKKKKSDSELVTRGILKEELANSGFVTKDHLGKTINAFRDEMKFMFEESDRRTDEKIQKSQNVVLTAIDPLLQEL